MNQRAYAKRRMKERLRFSYVAGYKLRPGTRCDIFVELRGERYYGGSFVARRGESDPLLFWNRRAA